MNRKIVIYITALLLLMPSLASANVILPFTLALLPMLPVIFLSEIVVFFITVRVLREKISPIRIIIAVIIANLVTSGIGLAYPVFEPYIASFILSFSISVIVEGFVYLLIFRKMFSIKTVFLISIITNSVSYLLIILKLLLQLII